MYPEQHTDVPHASPLNAPLQTESGRVAAIRAYVLDVDPETGVGASAAAAPHAAHRDPNAPWTALSAWDAGKVANPMTFYPEYRDSRPAGIVGEASLQFVLVEVETADGTTGIGITHGGVAVAAVVEMHLAAVVIGQSVLAHEQTWDRMYKSTLLYGRKGLVLHAISAVDLALWDAHGRLAQEPVWSLLGGTNRTLEMYATGPRPDAAQRLGFAGAKLPLTWAPVEGEAGFRANVDALEDARGQVDPTFPLMVDAWMSLDIDYAARLSVHLSRLGYRWLEEPLVPDAYDSYRKLRTRMPGDVALSTGEHEYTAAGFAQLCATGVDLVQPDPNWCGGLTELRRIAAVALAAGVDLIPHVGSHYSYHFASATPSVRMVEFPLVSGDFEILETQHPGLTGEILPRNGTLTLDDTAGFGLDRNPDASWRRPFAQASGE